VRLGAGWVQVVGYLELQDVHLNPKDKGTEILDNSQDVDEDEDPTTMHPDIVGEEEHCYTYHVIYNESYRVPMLFLHGCLRDGRLLQWQDVLQDLPLGSQHLTGESRWTFLTQEVFIPLGFFHEWSFLKYVKTFNFLYKFNYQGILNTLLQLNNELKMRVYLDGIYARCIICIVVTFIKYRQEMSTFVLNKQRSSKYLI